MKNVDDVRGIATTGKDKAIGCEYPTGISYVAEGRPIQNRQCQLCKEANLDLPLELPDDAVCSDWLKSFLWYNDPWE